MQYRISKTTFLFLFILSLVACGGGGGSSSSSAPTNTPPTNTPPTDTPPEPTAAQTLAQELAGLNLNDFLHVSYGALIRREPEAILWQSLSSVYPVDSVGLNDLTAAYTNVTYEMYNVVLDGLRAYDRSALSVSAKRDYDVYEWYLQDKVDEETFQLNNFPATYSIIAVQRDTEQLFSGIHPLATVQDAEDFITRLNAVNQKFVQLSNHLLRQRDAGVIEPRLTMEVALGDIRERETRGYESHPYYERFAKDIAEIPGISEAEVTSLRNDARLAVENSVKPGYGKLRSTLDALLPQAPTQIGVGQYANGEAYYAYALRHHSTTNLTPSQIHALGLGELERIHAEMRVIFDELGYPENESLAELYGRVADASGKVLADDALAAYESIINFAEARLDQAFDVLPSARVIVIADEFGGFYIGPSFDGTRPGAFYAGTAFDLSVYDMKSLTFHESVPGHHLQIALAMEQDVPDFRKLLHFTAFIEGWALYSERLAFELGWYKDDPYGNLGRLQYEALRAARLVMDTGIHDLGWSFETASQFNVDNVGSSLASGGGAAGRYSVWPGQATAYMVGMLQILEARQRAKDALGDKFDLKAFHRALLLGGAMPLTIMQQTIDEYIAQAQ